MAINNKLPLGGQIVLCRVLRPPKLSVATAAEIVLVLMITNEVKARLDKWILYYYD